MPLNVVEPRRLYQVVAGQIAGLIRTEEFRVGDRLPTERELVRQLGVSRPVIREAMLALEIAGLVEVRSGSGGYARGRPSSAQLSGVDAVWTEIGPFDIFGARLAMEGEVAATAMLKGCAERPEEPGRCNDEEIDHARQAAAGARRTDNALFAV